VVVAATISFLPVDGSPALTDDRLLTQQFAPATLAEKRLLGQELLGRRVFIGPRGARSKCL
jgi:hypothetical protein